jgi:hypothetical protein
MVSSSVCCDPTAVFSVKFPDEGTAPLHDRLDAKAIKSIKDLIRKK